MPQTGRAPTSTLCELPRNAVPEETPDRGCASRRRRFRSAIASARKCLTDCLATGGETITHCRIHIAEKGSGERVRGQCEYPYARHVRHHCAATPGARLRIPQPWTTAR